MITNGLVYTPDYVIVDRGGNQSVDYLDIAEGYSYVSLSETDFSYTLSMFKHDWNVLVNWMNPSLSTIQS